MTEQPRLTSYLAFGVEPSDRPYRLRLARYVALAETIAEFVRARAPRPDQPLRLLDAGAGNGRTLRYLEPLNVTDQIEFHAIEFDRWRIEHIYAADRWRAIVRADLTDGVPYADRSFDIVVCEQVLEHLQNPEPVVRELVRVLRPGGLMILGVPTFPPVLFHLRKHVVPGLDRLRGKRREHVQVFDTRALRQIVRRAGDARVTQIRGFRVISGGSITRLEHHRWWYRLNRRLGQWFPWACVEIQVLATRVSALVFPACVI